MNSSLEHLHRALSPVGEARVTADQTCWSTALEREVRREPGLVVVLVAPGEFHMWADEGDGHRKVRTVYRRGRPGWRVVLTAD